MLSYDVRFSAAASNPTREESPGQLQALLWTLAQRQTAHLPADTDQWMARVHTERMHLTSKKRTLHSAHLFVRSPMPLIRRGAGEWRTMPRQAHFSITRRSFDE